MTELKTLKDIRSITWNIEKEKYCKNYDVPKRKLRREAIKWINALMKKINKNDTDFCFKCGYSCDPNKTGHWRDKWVEKEEKNPFCDSGGLTEVGEVVQWIKHFFNISEKELKGGTK